MFPETPREKIVAVMRAAGESAHGRRLRGLIVICWRAGLRIQEALSLAEADLDHAAGPCSSDAAKAAAASRSAWITGAGMNSIRGLSCGFGFLSVRCSA